MKRANPSKDAFLKSIPQSNIESASKKFEAMAFSLQFFDNSQTAGQNFQDWNHEQLSKLLEKLKSYCCETMEYWKRMAIGHRSGHVLEIYGNFPCKSDFVFPKHVPIDVRWGRFRLEGDMRIIGFIIEPETCTFLCIPSNIFYIVFLDANHRFYKSA